MNQVVGTSPVLANNPYDTRLSYDNHTGLPSWVPDWSFRRQEGRILWTGCHREGPTLPFDASKGTSHRPNLLARMEESELVVSGRIIDSIASMLSSADRLELVEDRPRFFGLSDKEVTALDVTALSDPAQKLRIRLVVMFAGGCIGVAPAVEEVLQRYDEGQSPPDDIRRASSALFEGRPVLVIWWSFCMASRCRWCFDPRKVAPILWLASAISRMPCMGRQ